MYMRSWSACGLFCLASMLWISACTSAQEEGKTSAAAKLDLPADYVPQEKDFTEGGSHGMFMGMSQLRGSTLKLPDGETGIYLVNVPKVQPQDQPFMVGDIILNVDGRKSATDMVGLFKRRVEWAQNHKAAVTFLRWRKGKIDTGRMKFEGPIIPDLTKGGEHDPTRISWNLGTTGAHGWTWSIPHQTTEGSKQIYITSVEPGSPAEGVLKVGDVILGTYGTNFTHDSRKEFANALTKAETPDQGGKLVLSVWYDGKTRQATVKIPVMGKYSDTTPFDCDKSKKIIDEGVEHLKKTGIGDGITGYVNTLALLATGREDVMPMVREKVKEIAAKGHDLKLDEGMASWSWGYSNLVLTEYYLATHDESVLPAIREFSTKIAMGQTNVGSWGHRMSTPYEFSGGTVYGVAPGYGAMNQTSLVLMISMSLANRCGVDNEHIDKALERGRQYFRFFMDRGAVPYGDHQPGINRMDDNGKSSLAAIMFDLLGDKEAATFFTKLTIASYNEREGGHTGNFFSMLWGPMGAARGGDAAASAFMSRMDWFYDLERRRDGSFIYQGKPGMTDTRSNAEHQYKGWDCTGARLLAYCQPLKKLYITGKGRTIDPITGDELKEVVDAGRLTEKQYDDLPTSVLLSKLQNWAPEVRHNAAQALANKEDNVVPQLIAMLDSPNRYARYGACQGLKYAGRQSEAAADAIIAKGLNSDDPTMKFFAMRAFSSYDREMGLSEVGKRALPTMLKMATIPDPSDPEGRMKGQLAYDLFYSGRADPLKAVARNGEGVEQVDSDLLVQAVRELLKVSNGGNRSCVAAVYDKLSDEQLKQLWPDIYRAVRELAPSGIMFASGVRQAGIELMAKHHTKEGLETAVWYLTNQKYHGGRDRVKWTFDLIVNQYGGYAKPYIPRIKECEKYFIARFRKNEADELLATTEAAIKAIEAAPTPTWKMTSIAEYLK